jgi:hypothetical protein
MPPVKRERGCTLTTRPENGRCVRRPRRTPSARDSDYFKLRRNALTFRHIIGHLSGMSGRQQDSLQSLIKANELQLKRRSDANWYGRIVFLRPEELESHPGFHP